MAVRFDPESYPAAVSIIVSGMRHPRRTIPEMHDLLARQHPRLHARHATLFPGQHPAATGHNPPAIAFRGHRCTRCGRTVNNAETLVDGLGPTCRLALGA